MDFPSFWGERPRSWKRNCESYFRIFHLDPELWVDTAAMHFTGAAMVWLENNEFHLSKMEWEKFCTIVCDQFERNEFSGLLRQLFHLRQSESVSEYTTKFNELMHALLAHSTTWDPALFPSRFVDGLKDKIRVVVLVHNPKDLDTAVSLAYLQEEALEISKRKEGRRSDNGVVNRSHLRGAMPLPPPPGRPPPTPPAIGDGSRPASAEGARGANSVEERLTTLRAYRRARGLCYMCGEKWSRDHKCAAAVQLHVVQEMFEVLGMSSRENQEAVSDTSSECHTISKAALEGSVAPRTIRLQGKLQSQQVLMLVDSGSSHSFISSVLAAKLQGVRHSPKALKVKIADGGQLLCNQEITRCSWSVQGHKFCTDLKVLPLGCYDMIIGMDSLEEHSPMDVHWGQKHMSFDHHGKRITLRGVQPKMDDCHPVSVEQLHFLMAHNDIHQLVQLQTVSDQKEGGGELEIPPEIAELLVQFESLFQDPTGLPPARPFDHKIPLIPGAQPVNIRPYRYNPFQKDEIERQVKEMLRQGIIQESYSPYASPVLLVQKKDLSWRFCVDYRHLNAITVKNRFPMPVVEELLDELAGAVWFTSLDLKAGYHQIRMAPEDVFKTAFKTHLGLNSKSCRMGLLMLPEHSKE
ncbi:uncharacterized protein [Aegilops tauschii subsp. strangulata]|uniref:uncharacterized protein n=1 Tax=Aegilops tauschii subsp. strangulata TaxID=200361 RepID=UPI001ABCC9C7|nr:uncharacterized protein LOC120976705 [Aegilops tauschii subsp. strangulata]